MNDEELPPIGADDDDSRWSVERGHQASVDGAGTGSSADDPAGDEVGATPLVGDPLGDEAEAGSRGGDARGDGLADSDLSRSDWPTVRPDGPVMRRRRGKKERMWRETLQVEMPPTLNLLSLGIGFGVGCGFCLSMVALGFLPGSSVAQERGEALGQPQMREVIVPAMDDEVPLEPSQTAEERPDRADDMPAEPRKTEADQSVGDDEAPGDRSEADPEDVTDEPPGDSVGSGE